MLEYLVNRIQFGMEKELLKDIFGVILLIKKLKICIQNWRIGIFFIMQFHYFKKILLKYPFQEKLAGKEDRYWANRIVKKK